MTCCREPCTPSNQHHMWTGQVARSACSPNPCRGRKTDTPVARVSPPSASPAPTPTSSSNNHPNPNPNPTPPPHHRSSPGPCLPPPTTPCTTTQPNSSPI